MKKKLIIVFLIFILAGGAFVWYKHSHKSGPSFAYKSSNKNTLEKQLDPKNYTAGVNVGDAVVATDKKEVNIKIENYVYVITYLKIKKGTKVVWTNNSQTDHTVTSDKASPNKGLNSPMITPGATYEFTFKKPGLYEYYCTMYPSLMKAVITVVD